MKNYYLSFFKRYMLSLFCLIIVLFLTYIFCVTPNCGRQNELEPFMNYHYAHRGLFDNASSAPENSLLAFQQAIDHHYGIELDVQLTKDNVPIVIHDSNLNRLCGIQKNVAAMSYQELNSCYILDSLETPPLLEDALTLVNGQVPLMIELKVGYNYAKACEIIASLLDHYKGDYCIISFNPFALNWFKSNRPHVIRGQLATNHWKDGTRANPITHFVLTNLLTNFISRPDFISYNYLYQNNLSLNLCKNFFKVPIACWTISSEAQMTASSDFFDLFVFEGFTPQP